MPHSQALQSPLTTMFSLLLLLRVQDDSQPPKHSCGLIFLFCHLSAQGSPTPVSCGVGLLLVVLQDGLFIPQNLPWATLSTSSIFSIEASHSLVSFFQIDLFPSTHILTTTCAEDKSLSYHELQHCLCIMQYEGRLFSVYGFSLHSTLTQQCNCLEISSISVLIKSFTQSVKLVHAGLSTHKGDSLSELLSGRPDSTN